MAVPASPYHVLPDYADLISRLEQIRLRVVAEIERVEKELPSGFDNDVRLTTIIHIGQLIDSTNLALTFISTDLLPLNNKWWEEAKTAPFSTFNKYQKSFTINNFTAGFVKVGFVQNLFSTIDSSSRLLLRKLDPLAVNNATKGIGKVFEALCARLTIRPVDSKELMKLLQLVRNTIHNNGVFFPQNQQNDQVTYKGVTYNLEVGKPVKFVNWEFLIDRLNDGLQLLTEVIHDPNIIEITDEITDPFNIW